jgi:hypothetical protein
VGEFAWHPRAGVEFLNRPSIAIRMGNTFDFQLCLSRSKLASS